MPEERSTRSDVALTRVVPILDVRDVEAALRFYVERLGFEVAFRYEHDPGNYAGVRRGEVELHMQWQEQSHFDDGTAGRGRIRILTPDPDALHAEFRASGATREDVRIHDTEWGTREFGFRDPDGNGLIFFRDL